MSFIQAPMNHKNIYIVSQPFSRTLGFTKKPITVGAEKDARDSRKPHQATLVLKQKL